MIPSLTAEGRVAAAVRSPARLLVLYDAECALCARCRHWLEAQPTWVELRFAAAGDPGWRGRLGAHLPWLGAELVVLSDRGEAWVGPAAFLMCLWATRDYREWAYRLSGPRLAPLAEQFFTAVSKRRRGIGRVLGPPPVGCTGGRCRHRGRAGGRR